MDELNPNKAAAESQEERDSENAIVPDLTKVVDLKDIPTKETRIIFEVSREGDQYRIWAHNPSNSIVRPYHIVTVEHLEQTVSKMTVEFLGDIDADTDECAALTDANEEALKEYHGANYNGTDDDMSDDFDNWISNLELSEVKEILAKQTKTV